MELIYGPFRSEVKSFRNLILYFQGSEFYVCLSVRPFVRGDLLKSPIMLKFCTVVSIHLYVHFVDNLTRVVCMVTKFM